MTDTVSLVFEPADLLFARSIYEELRGSGIAVISSDPALVGAQESLQSRAKRFAALYDERNLGCLIVVGRDFARNFFQRPDRPFLIRALRRRQQNLQFLLSDNDLEYFLDRDLELDDDPNR